MLLFAYFSTNYFYEGTKFNKKYFTDENGVVDCLTEGCEHSDEKE